MHRSTTVRRGNAAFGLLALLVVAAIIFYLMFGIGGSSSTSPGGGGSGGGGGGMVGAARGARAQARAASFTINTSQLGILIATYRRDHNNQWPKSIDDIEAPEQMTRDPWGSKITLSFKDTPNGAAQVTYHSNGPDAQPGTADDKTIVAEVPPL